MNVDFDSTRTQLAARIARWTARGEQATAISGLSLYSHAETGRPVSCMLEPAIAIPVQGAKRALIGSEVYAYDRYHYLITSLEVPAVLQVAQATPDAPYLSAVLRLDERVIGQLVLESRLSHPDPGAVLDRGMVLGTTTASLLDAFNRLLGLMEEPELISVLAPLVQREIFYRILRSDIGIYLWQMVAIGSQSHRIRQAIDSLKADLREPLRVEDLAARVQMSPSRFHHHFRRLTSLSPIQFQKWLRLTEARRLMLTERLDASTAAFQVGYESPSQFSREYSRQFGAPPRRDIEDLLRQVA